MSRVDVASLEQGLLAGQRGALSRAITLIESNAVRHQEMAEELLDRLMPRTGARCAWASPVRRGRARARSSSVSARC